MRLFLTLVICFLSLPLFANSEVSTQIHEIDMGNPDELTMIYLSTGQVVTYPTAEKATMKILTDAITNRKWFALVINSDREIIDLREMARPQNVKSLNSFRLQQPSVPYNPSILKDLDQAKNFFYEARTNAKEESQCYNRAHVWTYEWRTKHNLYSSKAWLFFTRSFIRKYKFEWWFHVAPMIHVVVDGEVKERVMDVKYAKGPLNLKQWTDIFMRDNFDCPVVNKYSDQANNPEAGSCFLIKSSMYFYQPVDLEQWEINGEMKEKWLQPEVRNAYLDAFDVTL